MGSAFMGIEIGKRSVIAHQQGLATIGHNLSNASTEGYSRQRVEMKAFDPLYEPDLTREERPGQVGQGVEVASVQRVRDELLENKIVSTANGQGYWSQRDKYILMLEKIHNEPDEISVRGRMDKFWQGWQELAAHPDQLSARAAVLQRGEGLMDSIHNKFKNLKDMGIMLNEDVQVTTGELNGYLKDIAKLNVQILKVQAMGDNPNDLLDRRDLLVNKVADIVPITVENKRDPDEFLIHMKGVHLVQGKIATPLELQSDPANEGYWKIVRPDTKEDLPVTGGKLGSLIELRDTDVRGEIQKLDSMTMNFTDLVNEIHRAGYGLNGDTGLNFFKEYPAVLNADGSYDRNGDGALDTTLIFRVDGRNKLEAQQQTGLAGTLTLPAAQGNTQIQYFPTDTVQDIVNKINNSGAEVVARLDREGRLSLKGLSASASGNPDFAIRHLEDSGQFLVGYSGTLAASGAAGAFDWQNPAAATTLAGGVGGGNYAVAPLAHASAWVGINDVLKADPNKLAAGLGTAGRPAEGGDGSGALAIANIRNTQVMVGKSKTFDDFFADTVADIGLKGEVAAVSLDTQQKIMKDLTDFRQSISGVNIDEEMSNLLKFQHGYQAAAKFISEWSTMIDTIINRMGV